MARRALKEPVRGEFRVTGQYFARPGSTPMQETLTGVLTGPGIAPTPGEHVDNGHGRRIGHDVLPALIDRTDPTRFVILWDEVPVPDFRADAREQARQAAAQMQQGGTAAPAPEVYVYGDPDSGPVPEWARQVLEDVATGRLPGQHGSPGAVDGPPLVLDLTAGHLSAADADRLSATGEAATAVLTEVVDVAVPAAVLPGPTASLCDLTLQVSRRDGTTYTAGTRLGFRDAHRRATVAVLGSVLPVRVDPADPSRVAVDVTAFDAGRR
jgi:hypothetical protein